ncbi:DUF4249 domain-containing protein [Flavihumibacter sp. R14]|nr:DUF4249 domain-containing protein [Flavihumibacter soli]
MKSILSSKNSYPFRHRIAGSVKNVLLLCVPALLVLSACETVIEIDLPVEKPKLVVNSIFNADSLLTVNVTKSRPSSESGHDFETVENAIVEVFKDRQSLGILSYHGKGNYKTLNKFPNEPSAEYAITVKAPGFNTAETRESMPLKPVISAVQVEADRQNSLKTSKEFKTRFILHDPAESNFYFLRAWLVNKKGDRSPVNVSLRNILGQFSPLRSEPLKIYVFDDKSFNAKDLNIELDIQTYIASSDLSQYSISIEIASIPKSYFDYLYSVKKQFEDIPLLEPKNLPLSNNIQNGLGVFAPYNAVGSSFDLIQ